MIMKELEMAQEQEQSMSTGHYGETALS